MRNVGIIMRRELASYFATPLAYVFILIFLMLANAFTFYLGGFYERGQADLAPFFNFHPWLYLFLIPAISMKLWAEERKSGSIELLLTQPVTLWEAVLGKFFAAWLFTALALALTFPLWITVNYLGSPDVRSDSRGVRRQPAGGRRAAVRRLMHVGTHAQPGSRVHPRRGHVLRAAARRLPDRARRIPQLAAAGVRGCDRIAGVPHPLRVDRQGGHRPARPVVFRDADRVLPARDLDRAGRA